MANTPPTDDKEEKPAEGSFGAAAHERPVPRISIEAFSEFPDTLGALHRAAGDRRLSKAHINIQTGDAINVTMELMRRGYTDDEIGKIWGGNLLRVMEKAEQYAAGPKKGAK